ncbi:MAG: hypothetical protein KF746_18805 [Chitinophagaceae bacterium]|nr:hypothetical protein [Chitinophagaceae bacterium]
MKKIDLQIIPIDLAEQYKGSFAPALQKRFDELHDSELSIETVVFTLLFRQFSHQRLKERRLTWIRS